MKYIKKFNEQFESEDFSELEKFEDDLRNQCDDYTGGMSSFVNFGDNRLDEYYSIIKNGMLEIGWTDEKLKTLFTSFTIDEIFRKTSLDTSDGMTDYYLYKTFESLGLDKNQIRLGGDGWANQIFSDEIYDGDDGTEAQIRYRYGYHKSKYGILILEQAGLKPIDLVLMTDYGIGTPIKEFLLEKNIVLLKDDIKKCVIIEDDKITILTEKLSKKIYSGTNYEWSTASEDISNYLKGFLNELNCEFDILPNEFFIYGDFKDYVL